MLRYTLIIRYNACTHLGIEWDRYRTHPDNTPPTSKSDMNPFRSPRLSYMAPRRCYTRYKSLYRTRLRLDRDKDHNLDTTLS